MTMPGAPNIDPSLDWWPQDWRADVASTPRDVMFRDGTASLYRFRPHGEPDATKIPFLLVPSMINRWYVLDLRPGASLAEAMVKRGIDTYLLDWGIPEDEDRYLTWSDILARLDRMVRRVKRETGADKVAMLGYCMGGTLSTIYTALHPEHVAGLVSLTAPVDFSEGGFLRTLVDEKWFDPEAMTACGNLGSQQMQSGFTTLRPTGQIGKWVGLADRWSDKEFRKSFFALETWSGDNIPFPATAYQTYITELYQKNLLAHDKHFVNGKRVVLGDIKCPLLTVVATKDNICPPCAATWLHDHVGSADREVLRVEGGHVGAVIGSKAPRALYPGVADWLIKRFGPEAAVSAAGALVPAEAAPAAPVEVAAESAVTEAPSQPSGNKRRGGKPGEN